MLNDNHSHYNCKIYFSNISEYSLDINRLKSIGRNIEREVFSKAIKLYCEDGIFVACDRTIVFE